MDFRILGPVEVRSGDGAEIPVVGLRHRAALCVLALSSGTPVSGQRLTDALWGDDLPRDPAGALRSCVYGLRRALAPHDRIRTHPVGYMLKLKEHDSLDVQSFRTLAVTGRQELAAGRHAAAAGLLAEALGLWREPALADLPSTDVMAAEAALLTEQHRAVQDSLIDARLALGHHQQLTAHLQAVVAGHPLREHSWAQLMLALYRCGSRAEALAAYSAARAGLAAEYGIDPGAELQELLRQILTDDPALTLPAQPASLVQDPARAGAMATARLRQLPPAITDFTGRREEIGRLVSLLNQAGTSTGMPIAVISGPPGAGKTTLALQVAHSVAAQFTDGQLYLEMAGSSRSPRPPGQLLGEALTALGVPGGQIPDSAAERAAMYRSRLADRRVLVVADDAGTAGQLRLLLPGTAGCAVIVTSRAQLGDVPGAGLLPLDTLPPGEAVEMLASIVGRDRLAAEPAAAEQITAACGHLPLAIRIAAAKLVVRATWSLGTLASRLSDRRRRLDELVIGDTGVRAAVDLSYQALDPGAQRAFRRLALAGPHDVAEWVIGALAEGPAGPLAAALVERSLLTPAGVDAAGQRRYCLHDLLRDYAAEQFAGEPEADQRAARDRLLAGMHELADAAQAALPPMSFFPPPLRVPRRIVISDALANHVAADPRAWFRSEWRTLPAAALLACEAGNHQTAAHLAACAAAYQFAQGRFDEARDLWQAVIAAAEAAGDVLAAAHARQRLASMLALRQEFTQAAHLLDECIPALEHGGDPFTLARALYWRAFCAAEREDFAAASSDAERSLALAQQLDDRPAQSLNLRVLGRAAAFLGDPEAGCRLCEEAVAIARGCGSPSDELQAIHTLAQVSIAAGRPELAVKLCRREAAPRPLFAAAQVLADAYFGDLLGEALHALGRYAEAAREHQRAIGLFDQYGTRRPRAVAQYHLGCSLAGLGDHERAISSLQQCLPVLRECGMSGYVRRVEDQLDTCRRSLT